MHREICHSLPALIFGPLLDRYVYTLVKLQYSSAQTNSKRSKLKSRLHVVRNEELTVYGHDQN